MSDVVFDVDGGRFHVAGTPARSFAWVDLAAAADAYLGRAAARAWATSPRPAARSRRGAHLAVVEVDIETGKATLVRFVAVDDAGRILNPLLAEGQVHGGLAQGAAQALLEEVVYDEDGNPLTSTFADYPFISAAELPSFETVHLETPSPLNDLGAKGIGESGQHRLDAGGAERGRRRPQPPRRPPRPHAGDARAGLAGHPRRRLTVSLVGPSVLLARLRLVAGASLGAADPAGIRAVSARSDAWVGRRCAARRANMAGWTSPTRPKQRRSGRRSGAGWRRTCPRAGSSRASS